MIDSVLKGTGNSRFLKSAVPAGTSWADALAMLQAGTFPIDFNGINTEGFQQVGTPLNKENLLKDATAAQIGLPPSTTPDGMFQALGNTGELHVWRKTVTTAQEQPAGFTLGDVQTNVSIGISVTSGASLSRSHNINVSDAGVATLDMSDTYAGTWTTDNSITTLNVSGYYISLSGNPTQSAIQVGDVYYVPSGGAIVKNGSTLYLTSAQKVNAHGIIPAGTTTTYPVSTNPKAYQEGDDAKAAGYVVGEVVTGNFFMSDSTVRNTVSYQYSDKLNVAEDGTVSLNNPSQINFDYESYSGYETTVMSAIRGKFLRFYSRSSGSDAPSSTPPFNTTPSAIVYIPADAIVTYSNKYPAGFYLDKYQPVTGYAAIPAGTTIEYLGKLGDKARMQVVSYVGTGTYGSENDPITLTFPFAPKYARFIYNYEYAEIPLNNLNSTGYTKEYWGSTSSGRPVPTKISEDGKTLSWYGNYGADYASNSQGSKYRILIVG